VFRQKRMIDPGVVPIFDAPEEFARGMYLVGIRFT
jgi:hypothetical protein